MAFLDFASNFQDHDEREKLFLEIDRFLREQLGACPLLIYSYPKNIEEYYDSGISETFRSVWNRDAIGKFYDRNNVFEFITHISDKGNINNIWVERKMEDRILYAFYCGDDDKQTYFAIFKTGIRNKVNPDVLKNLISFTGNAFRCSQKLSNLIKAKSLIHLDDVTNLFNHRKLILDLDRLIERYEENAEGFLVIFIDIDHFKHVNDGHGHLVGTKLLIELAKILKALLRESDLTYRYGGDEFVMLVPGSTLPNGRLIGERILKAVNKNTFQIGGSKVRLSVSIGIAVFPEDAKNRNDILAFADQMMYQAKATGRDRVCTARELFKTQE